MLRYIDLEPVLADKVSNAYISRFELEQQPILDVVEVVRCKDCKFLYIKDFVYGTCNKNMCGIVKPDDYCSQGQKREGK